MDLNTTSSSFWIINERKKFSLEENYITQRVKIFPFEGSKYSIRTNSDLHEKEKFKDSLGGKFLGTCAVK